MSNIRRFLTIVLSIVLCLTLFVVDCKAVEIIDMDNVVSYSIPLISNESNAEFIDIYEINEGYYLDLRDIAMLTRCKYEEYDEMVILMQGTRKLKINVETCVMNDSDIRDQGTINLKKFDNFYLCEAVPMLLYLGADCSINEETGCFQVLMPMITFWEAFMPDYLHYHFNTEEWMGSKEDVEKALFCDILAELIDVTNGHGLYATDFEQVENYMAEYLYLMTNCTIVPIVDYNSLNDDILNAAIVNELAAGTNNVVGESLKEYLASQVGADNIIDFCAADFDNDSTIEAFAIVGEVSEWGDCFGSLYYVKNNTLQLVLEDEGFWVYTEEENILDFGNEKFYITGKYYTTGDSTYIFGVSNGTWYEHDFSEYGMALTQIGDSMDLSVTHSTYDYLSDGTGHTWKEYYLYWDDGFKEYGAIYISEDDLIKCDGAKDILNQISSKGGMVTEIMYRGNGIININYEIGAYNIYENATLKLNGNSVSLVTVNDYGEDALQKSSYGGIYLTARYPDIASYPNSYPVK